MTTVAIQGHQFEQYADFDTACSVASEKAESEGMLVHVVPMPEGKFILVTQQRLPLLRFATIRASFAPKDNGVLTLLMQVQQVVQIAYVLCIKEEEPDKSLELSHVYSLLQATAAYLGKVEAEYGEI